MLVKVSSRYFGVFGLYNEGTNAVLKKDRTSAPFEIDDALAPVYIEKGILVDASRPEALEEGTLQETPEDLDLPEDMPEDVTEEPLREESEEDIPMDIPERIPEENPGEEDDLDSITDYKVLKSMAKDAGINPFGKTKDELRTAIREKRAEEGQ